mmetsp:Transcript_61426/g.158453  ORF Transcript_61426/g.158453 Transcript_61426/m.158453 type:complete len:329 (-) Transcript_61426:545-1531(-)
MRGRERGHGSGGCLAADCNTRWGCHNRRWHVPHDRWVRLHARIHHLDARAEDGDVTSRDPLHIDRPLLRLGDRHLDRPLLGHAQRHLHDALLRRLLHIPCMHDTIHRRRRQIGELDWMRYQLRLLPRTVAGITRSVGRHSRLHRHRPCRTRIHRTVLGHRRTWEPDARPRWLRWQLTRLWHPSGRGSAHRRGGKHHHRRGSMCWHIGHLELQRLWRRGHLELHRLRGRDHPDMLRLRGRGYLELQRLHGRGHEADRRCGTRLNRRGQWCDPTVLSRSRGNGRRPDSSGRRRCATLHGRGDAFACRHEGAPARRASSTVHEATATAISR